MQTKIIITRNIILLIFAMMIGKHIEAQFVFPSTLNNGGGQKAAGSIIIEDALGGLLVNAINTPVMIYTQDFLQPDAGVTSIIPMINDVFFNAGSGIDNAGKTLINGNIMLDFTLGETASITLNEANNILTQGILQPFRLYVWTGIVNTSWPNSGNWEGNLIPDKGDAALIPSSCPHYPIITSGVIAKCKTINLKQGASLTIENGGLLKVYQ